MRNMINITLVCAAGMSTSMLMSKMKTYATKGGFEVEVKAMPEAKFADYKGHTDILLLGPQVSYMIEKMKAAYEPKGIKVAVINMTDYGMMNGEKVLKDSLALMN